MASVLGTLAALTVIGLLFALDPGGAIAQTGFPDYQDMDWKQLTVWGFRTIGVGVALLLVMALWIRYRPRRRIKSRDTVELGTRQRIGLPAAVLSVLEDREVSDRTLLAAIVEMCQRGALRFEYVGMRTGFLYRLSQQGPTQFEWEQLMCDSLPSRPTKVKALRDQMNEHKDAIGDQLGEYLQRQGLFHDNPIRIRRERLGDGSGWATLAAALMGVGSGLWLALWLPQWWANSLAGAVVGCIYWFIAMPMHTGMLPPAEAGAYQIGQWLGLKESLTGPDPAAGRGEPDPMLAYAIALDAAQPWLDVSVSAPLWFGSSEAASLRAPDLDVAYHGFMSAPEWGLSGRSEGGEGAAAGPGDKAERELLRELSQLETLHSEQAEGTANRGTAAEHWPAASRADALEPDQTLYKDGKVRLSQRRLALSGRTIELLAISSVRVDQQPGKTGRSNWFLKAPGFLFMLGGGLLLAAASGLFLWDLLFHVLNWFGLVTEECEGGMGWVGTCRPFERNSAIEWAMYGAVIVIAFPIALVGQWLDGKSARIRSMYCAAVAVDGEGETVYFGHSEERASAEVLVAEVRKAQTAARRANDAKDGH